MRNNSLLIGLGYGVLAVALAIAVAMPVFVVVNFIYDDGRRLTPLMLVVVAVWLALAWGLSRRRIGL